MSNTAKRILDVMSKYNTPLTELRRVSNALPTIAETSLSGKRAPIDLNITNELEKTKRALLKPNTPYNRPYGRNETPLTTELHVPSMPELLRLKKFATKTIEIRESASQSDSVLNKPIPVKQNEFKIITKPTMPATITTIDMDDSGSTASKNNTPEQVSNGDVPQKQAHRNKIRTNMNKRRMGRGDESDELPEQVDLPNVALPLGDKKDLFVGFKFQTADSKSTTTASNGPNIPFQFTKTTKPAASAATTKASATNGTNADGAAKRKAIACKEGTSVSSQSTTAFESGSTLKPTFTFNEQPIASSTKPTLASDAYKFAKPIIVPYTNQIDLYNVTVPTKPYIFSKPIFVDDKMPSQTSLTNLRFDPKTVRTVTSDSGIADTSQSFGSAGNKSTGTLLSKEDSGSAMRLSQASTELNSDNTLFKSISVKQKQDKWECSACLISNDKSANKCACCGSDNPSTKAAAPKPLAPLLSATLVAGKSSKWDCKTCMVPNDVTANKCVCCGESNGNAAGAAGTTAKLATPQKTFSFGSFSTSSTPSQPSVTRPATDNVFKSIVAKQKAASWECSACMTKNDVTKSKCICCDQAKEAITSTNSDAAKPSTPQFSFGSLGTSSGFGAAPSTSQFSFGNKEIGSVTPSTTYSFGNLNKINETPVSGKVADKTENVVKAAEQDAPKLADTPKIDTPALDKPKETSTNLFGSGFGASASSAPAPASEQPKETSSNLFSGFGSSPSTASTSALGSFAFGKPSATPSATVISTPKPEVDNVLKKIVAEQSAKWECQACMTKNESTVAKCVCCETPKDPSAAVKSTSELPKSSFVFGNPTASTSFTFGTKPSEAKPESAAAPKPSVFGSASFGKPTSGTASFQFGSSSNTAAVSSSPSSSITFGSPKSTFAASNSTAAPAFGGFSFGSNATKSTDVTDTGVTKPADNVLAKANGPVATAQSLFSFTPKTPTIETVSKPSLKRSNQDANEDMAVKTMALPSAPAATSFVFGQPQVPVASNTFGGIASASPASSTPDKPVLFGSPASQTTSSFASPFAAPKPFAFGSSSGAASTPAASSVPSFASPATAPNPAPSQNVFGSNAFSATSAPAIGGFGGMSATPTFGSTVAAPVQSPIVSGSRLSC